MKIARGRVHGRPSNLAGEKFDGEVWQDLIMPPTSDGTRATTLFFAPGGHTRWHRHEGGQFLVVTIGEGIICARGEEPQRLSVGDVVWISKDEEHWHGGSGNCLMSHLAISFGETTYLEPVEQDDYESATVKTAS